ncbi:MAG: hypothetical protein LC803_21345 [Acidobacteria bacterium]|nr:hypothetical protein [Acidobacteriota bacterium]
MSDVQMPEEIISWMESLMWGPHHDQWHFERRWDFWHFIALHGTPSQQEMVKKMIAYAQSQHWKRSEIQEGQAGNGLDFLMMHRAMMHLIVEKFPEHKGLLEGWQSPPTDPQDPDDPVPNAVAFDQLKAAGVKAIENDFASFAGDDGYGLFIETDIRPLPDDPTHRDPDKRLGVHNYLHNRWTDDKSPINLGDPKVNIFNRRFWKLHGWIDTQWTRFRQAKGLSDDDPQYKAALTQYKHMMGEHMHPMFAASEKEAAIERPAGFSHFFQF